MSVILTIIKSVHCIVGLLANDSKLLMHYTVNSDKYYINNAESDFRAIVYYMLFFSIYSFLTEFIL